LQVAAVGVSAQVAVVVLVGIALRLELLVEMRQQNQR
jgi:hypothetical protein